MILVIFVSPDHSTLPHTSLGLQFEKHVKFVSFLNVFEVMKQLEEMFSTNSFSEHNVGWLAIRSPIFYA